MKATDLSSGDLSSEEQWEECLKCLNILNVASDVNGSVLDTAEALGADWAGLELLGTVSGVMRTPNMQEEHMAGLFSPLIFSLACFIQVQQKEKAAVRTKLRRSERNKKIAQKQLGRAINDGGDNLSKMNEIFAPIAALMKSLHQLRGKKVKRSSLSGGDGADRGEDIVERASKVPRVIQTPSLLSDVDLVDHMSSPSDDCQITGSVTNTSEPAFWGKLKQLGLKLVRTEALGNWCPLSVAQGFGFLPTQESSDTFRETLAAVLHAHAAWREHFDINSIVAW
ncbi:hypothetical protein CYMTET_38036 [Cymbomonas tetramitiformis]|uniref:Uncharacterized protein n=1 Tax=Cymbomonas tetramitiformis TaxID=36881 RepID=A0AAE0CEA3_9CHLO|nr:hypothetical protein CYMTET_38036 [Cymbomonas tetramitiformis]